MKIHLNSTLLGWNGLSSFVFSNLLIIISLGLSLLSSFIKVLLMAKSYPINAPDKAFAFILVPGIKLDNNTMNNDFLARLKRARFLFEQAKLDQSKEQQKLIILGGITHNNSISEAAAGASYFYRHSINKKSVILEDQSQNTLENLKNAKNIIAQAPSLIISNRYHLYRIHCLADNLQVNTFPIAAEEQFELSIKMLIECLREAYFVHWYFSGKLWLKITTGMTKID